MDSKLSSTKASKSPSGPSPANANDGSLAQRDERLRRIAALFYVVAVVVALILTQSPIGESWPRTSIYLLVPVAVVSVVLIWRLPWDRLPHNAFALINVSSLALSAVLVNWTGGWTSPFSICAVFATVFSALYYQRTVALGLALVATGLSISPLIGYGLPERDGYGQEVAAMLAILTVNAMVHFAVVFVGQALAREIERLHYEALNRVKERDREIQRRRELEAMLVYQAHHDSLTALPNRTLFVARLSECLNRTEGAGTALLLMDLNGFKPVNDNYGHAVGDQLLRAVALRLRAVVGDHGMAARLGGDEFTVVLPELTSAAQAEAFANRIGSSLAEPYVLPDGPVSVSASVGVAWVPTNRRDLRPDAVLRAADLALYKAKADGKRCIRMSASLDA